MVFCERLHLAELNVCYCFLIHVEVFYYYPRYCSNWFANVYMRFAKLFNRVTCIFMHFHTIFSDAFWLVLLFLFYISLLFSQNNN